MHKSIFTLLILAVLFTNCKKEQDPFQISKQHVGLLTDSTQVKDLEAIFSNDSIIRYKGETEFTGDISNIEIYNKEGNKLLMLSPNRIIDSTSVITNVHILDSR